MLDLILTVGQSRRLSVSSLRANDTKGPPQQPITWDNNDPTIIALSDASFDGTSVTATALQVGTAELTINSGSFMLDFTVGVMAVPDNSVTDISILYVRPVFKPRSDFHQLFIVLNDSFGVSDSMVHRLTANRLLTESLGASTSAIRILTYLRSIASNLGTLTNAAAHPQAGVTFNVSISDRIGETDLATRIANAFRKTIDNLGITTSANASLPAHGDSLIQEAGGYILQEDGTSTLLL